MNFVGAIPRSRRGISGYTGGQGASGFSGYSGYAPSTPPLPAFDNVVGAWGLNNWNPGTATDALEGNSATAEFTAVAPYPVDYDAYITDADVPPYLVDVWDDQNV